MARGDKGITYEQSKPEGVRGDGLPVEAGNPQDESSAPKRSAISGKPQRFQVVVFYMLLALVCALLFCGIRASQYPNNKEQYRYKDEADQIHCSFYSADLVFLWKGGVFLNKFNGAIVAVLTMVLAGTSYLQWQAIKRQADIADAQRLAADEARAANAAHLEQSLNASKASSEAASGAAKAAEEAPYVERAWLSYERLEYGPMVNAHFQDVFYPEAFSFKIIWVNSGRTPAINARMFVAKEVVDRDAAVPKFTAKFRDDSAGVIGPKAYRHTNSVLISAADFHRLVGRTVDLYLYSKIIYHDVFRPDETRVSELVFRVRHMGQRITQAGAEEYFQFNPTGQQNACT